LKRAGALVEIYPVIVGEGLPAKQGLKLGCAIIAWAGYWVGEGLPAKQGLKRCFCCFWQQCHNVGEGLPAKQGLKQHYPQPLAARRPGWRGSSSKTRIETLVRSFHLLLSHTLARVFQQNKD